MTGKTAIITEGNSPRGMEHARFLARCNAQVCPFHPPQTLRSTPCAERRAQSTLRTAHSALDTTFYAVRHAHQYPNPNEHPHHLSAKFPAPIPKSFKQVVITSANSTAAQEAAASVGKATGSVLVSGALLDLESVSRWDSASRVRGFQGAKILGFAVGWSVGVVTHRLLV